MVSVNNIQLDNDNWSENSFNCSEVLCKVREEMASLRAEHGKFRVEVETVKALSLEKNNVLMAKLETMEQKLEVAELKAKLAKQEMHDLVAEKVSEMADQMEEKQRKNMEEVHQKFEEQLRLLKNEMAEKDRDLGKMAKQLDDVSTELRGKVCKLEDQQAVDGRNKLEEVRELTNLTKLEWSNNKWLIPDQKRVRASADGLTVKTIGNDGLINVRAQQPVSRAVLDLIPGQKLVYWEVQMKKIGDPFIGWVGPNFPLDTKWIGELPDSFSIDCCGDYWESGHVDGHGHGFGEGDVVGTGLLLTRDGRLKLFFTQNGELDGESIVLEESQELLLYPAVTLFSKGESVESNFGADTVGKPFMFDVNAHETELFD